MLGSIVDGHERTGPRRPVPDLNPARHDQQLALVHLGRALRFARDLRAGGVKVNQESAGIEPHLPFGGMKGSSNGWREQGTAAKGFFTEWKSAYNDPDRGLA
jgi:acyl-CoA reductase-like NAD-dependent aldehyde dehydrogenase